ncbi:MAG: universal stress protein [Ferruginibacter sp.]
MKKIILAFDGIHFSEGAFEFARRLNELQPLLLTGVFLPQGETDESWRYASIADGSDIPQMENSKSRQVRQIIDRFESRCLENGIDFRVHKDFTNIDKPELKNEGLFSDPFRELAMPELRRESCYADLLILGSEVFYENMGTHSPSQYLKDVLHDVKCPVLLLPEKLNFPESIILAYDGTEDSIFAIKQFAYLFPELTNLPALLVYANEDAEADFPDKIPMEELLARHFIDLTLFKLDADPKKQFSSWISRRKSAMLVSGSYGRSGLSAFFKKSFVNEIIADHLLPVFVAHK